MKTQNYTEKQIAEFAQFCERHQLTFANMIEYNSALAQYFTEE